MFGLIEAHAIANEKSALRLPAKSTARIPVSIMPTADKRSKCQSANVKPAQLPDITVWFIG